MKKILLVNPAIYDFTAYDFWLGPYGLLTVGGYLSMKCDIRLFDYLDRADCDLENDKWGRGAFPSEKIDKPDVFKDIPRYYKRFGRARTEFQDYLQSSAQFDFVLIQTVMTYWYPGVKEVIDDIRKFQPTAKIVLGGVYSTICHSHASSLGADFVLQGIDLEPLWEYLNIQPNKTLPPFWHGYKKPNNGVIKISYGCPFKCTYCSVCNMYSGFQSRDIDRSLAELDQMVNLGIKNIAFYDDALLYKTEELLEPFLKKVIERNYNINFHTPNAINARFVNQRIAELMAMAGFKTFYIGFESNSARWQGHTGGKVYSYEFIGAIETLVNAGIDRRDIIAYQIFGHPKGDRQQVEDSIKFAHDLGVRVMLADFSPIPGTPDGQYCRKWIDLDEPLCHNKTAFPIWLLGHEKVNRIKQQCKELNRKLQ